MRHFIRLAVELQIVGVAPSENYSVDSCRCYINGVTSRSVAELTKVNHAANVFEYFFDLMICLHSAQLMVQLCNYNLALREPPVRVELTTSHSLSGCSTS